MEEKAISAMGEQQSSNKNIVGYILAFLLGAFVATIILYLTFSSMFIEICNTGTK
ncbi:MAG: hypothetical protein PHR57_03165 [Patescibacteria group bacterium]|jgi:glycerol uptake facilitator-like aquaporin|nr:hypothetical protein [Patescibacteria group bacterium]